MAMRRLAVWLVVFLAVMAPARPAAAHGSAGSTDYRTEFTTVTGSLEGVELRVRNLGARIELERTTATEVVLLGYQGEPYLRFDDEGVWRNSSSPATYLNEDRYASVTMPANADAAAEPTWDHLSSSDTFSWHDHRAHWMSTQPPPITSSEPDIEHVVYEDTIRLEIDGRDVSVGTRVTWVPAPAQSLWLAGVGVAAGAAIALVLVRPRVASILGVLAPLAATVTRLSGPLWMAVPVMGLLVGVVAARRGSARLAGVAGLTALVTAALRLDVFEHTFLPGAVPPTVQRITILVTIAVAAGAVLGGLVAPGRGRLSATPTAASA